MSYAILGQTVRAYVSLCFVFNKNLIALSITIIEYLYFNAFRSMKTHELSLGDQELIQASDPIPYQSSSADFLLHAYWRSLRTFEPYRYATLSFLKYFLTAVTNGKSYTQYKCVGGCWRTMSPITAYVLCAGAPDGHAKRLN